jgi:hypothetical protein
VQALLVGRLKANTLAATGQIEELGGKTVVGVFADPEGTVIGLLKQSWAPHRVGGQRAI